MSEKCIARIVPVPAEGRFSQPTQGTRVMVGDVELWGVTRIELVAEVNSTWKANIECHVHATDLMAEAFVFRPRMTLLQHLREWWRNLPHAKDFGPG